MRQRNFRQMLETQWAKGNFVCVGLEPDWKKILDDAKKKGRDMTTARHSSVVPDLLDFCRQIVKATKDLVCAYKPSAALFQEMGDQGVWALVCVIQMVKRIAPNVPVIYDANLAGIGDTGIGCARFCFEFLEVDAVTVSPHLGVEALQPFLKRKENGVFALCCSSNRGASEFEDRKIFLTFEELTQLVGDADNANTLNGKYSWSYPTGGYHVPVYQHLALQVSRQWNKIGNCALVVSGAHPDKLRAVRGLVGDMPILVTDIGGRDSDLVEAVSAGKDSRRQGMIVNFSSAVIFATKGADFAEAARRETERLRNLINWYRTDVGKGREFLAQKQAEAKETGKEICSPCPDCGAATRARGGIYKCDNCGREVGVS
jgi:orotidine-5'-phosphate decarboxylase